MHHKCQLLIDPHSRKSGCCAACQHWRNHSLSSSNATYQQREQLGNLAKHKPSVGVESRYLQDHQQAEREASLRRQYSKVTQEQTDLLQRALQDAIAKTRPQDKVLLSKATM